MPASAADKLQKAKDELAAAAVAVRDERDALLCKLRRTRLLVEEAITRLTIRGTDEPGGTESERKTRADLEQLLREFQP